MRGQDRDFPVFGRRRAVPGPGVACRSIGVPGPESPSKSRAGPRQTPTTRYPVGLVAVTLVGWSLQSLRFDSGRPVQVGAFPQVQATTP